MNVRTADQTMFDTFESYSDSAEAEGARALASAVWACARNEPRETQVALAWLIRNRAERADGSLARASEQTLADCGQTPLGAAPDPFADPKFGQLIGVLSDVRLSAYGDPTKGAVRLHRHDSWPDWAEALIPTGLFGPWLFYGQAAA